MIERERAGWIFQTMHNIRAFEQKALNLFEANKLRGSVHLYIGQEGVAAAVCSNLTDEDYISSTHRGHGHSIAKGARLDKAMAELMGKETGYCMGRGGSMHISDLTKGNLGANAIVGGGIPIAVGAALAAKLKSTDQVTV
ncbi:MAG: thiamine pyrophosphate-dependent enzyme, partial [Clostridia bacterium]|nr:thiamine pyrophosphate-dependent enzyme [Clostridia bacterium]